MYVLSFFLPCLHCMNAQSMAAFGSHSWSCPDLLYTLHISHLLIIVGCISLDSFGIYWISLDLLYPFLFSLLICMKFNEIEPLGGFLLNEARNKYSRCNEKDGTSSEKLLYTRGQWRNIGWCLWPKREHVENIWYKSSTRQLFLNLFLNFVSA
jgi:hypothetical protein